MTPPAPKQQSRRWTPKDLEVLSELAGELPWQLVAKRFNQRRPPQNAHGHAEKGRAARPINAASRRIHIYRRHQNAYRL